MLLYKQHSNVVIIIKYNQKTDDIITIQKVPL